jgi:hypothetical protein
VRLKGKAGVLLTDPAAAGHEQKNREDQGKTVRLGMDIEDGK